MKMVTRTALENMKYYRSKNILTGIAIVLTTLLLFVVPTVGWGMVNVQYAAVNKLYPSWHALYRNVDEKTAEKLAAHHDISRYGLRSDAGIIEIPDADASMMYLDEEGMDLYHISLAEGRLPKQENEIVVSPGMMAASGQSGNIGDTIKLRFQMERDGGLDYTEEKEFKICGLLKENELSGEQKSYTAFISEAFLKKEIPREQITYRFLFQVNETGKMTTDKIEEKIKNIADQFEISEDDTNINEDYLGANYVDPSLVPIITGIMVIIVLAGAITIYSIYYVSMNQRIQEFGRLKAIGATRRQIKKIVLREGFGVAAIAIPAGLLMGTAITRIVMLSFLSFSSEENEYLKVMDEVIRDGEVTLYYWWIYLLVIVAVLFTVYLSLLKPMHMASRISEIEAMRYHGVPKKKSRRKGYEYLTIGRLTRRNLAENKKKSVMTIVAMGVTGMFLMIVATVLSCADPKESANGSIVGQYEIFPIVEDNNKEHPEWAWSEVQKSDLMNDKLKKQIERLDGVKYVETFSRVRVECDAFTDGDYNAISGIPEAYAKELEKGITEGEITYEELKSGDKVIVDRALLHWYPELGVGDRIKLTVHDGDRSYEKEVEIAAVGEYRIGLTDYDFFIMAKEAADKLCENNHTGRFCVMADQDYDETLEESLKKIVDQSGRLQMRTWKEQYDTWKSGIALTSSACYAFLTILAVISVMNLINTMINSVHVRKKELGMMQAIGMSDKQLMRMLQYEGLFYTLGTLIISVGLGSLAGYPVFLYAKATGMFEIRKYHYPVTAAVIVSVSLLLIQILLALLISRSVRKDSLIERIRFSE